MLTIRHHIHVQLSIIHLIQSYL